MSVLRLTSDPLGGYDVKYANFSSDKMKKNVMFCWRAAWVYKLEAIPNLLKKIKDILLSL